MGVPGIDGQRSDLPRTRPSGVAQLNHALGSFVRATISFSADAKLSLAPPVVPVTVFFHCAPRFGLFQIRERTLMSN
jgi:hypothetical protein